MPAATQTSTSLPQPTTEAPIKALTADCYVHELNPRQTRTDESIETLANHMKTVGYNRLRAMWAVKDDDSKFAVFGGGTRLSAAKKAELEHVYVYAFDGLTDEQICQLADRDNTDDTYHTPVPEIDQWHSCWYLANEKGWTHETIATAKGADRTTVTRRIQMHERIHEKVKQSMCDGTLKENHVIEFLPALCDVSHFPEWLNDETIQIEMLETVINLGKAGSKSGKPTVMMCRDAATAWKAFISKAQEIYNGLDAEWQPKFVELLAKRKVRSLPGVTAVEKLIRDDIASARRLEEAAKMAELKEIQKKSAKEEGERIAAAKREETLARIQCGDVVALINNVPEFSLLLTEPPIEDFRTLHSVLSNAHDRASEEASAVIICPPEYEQETIGALEDAGWKIRDYLVITHAVNDAGDKKTTFAKQHKRAVYAVKGNPSIVNRSSNVFKGDEPLKLAQELIKCLTHDREMVLDPWAGDGSIVFAAIGLGREVAAIEESPQKHGTICEALIMRLDVAG